LLFYLVWQWLVIGVIPQEQLNWTLQQGRPVTETFQTVVGKNWMAITGKAFGFFAVVTSMLGVSFSLVDFLGDALKIKKRTGLRRIGLCLLTFGPPFVFASGDPQAFIYAIGIAGGFGEAFLNGILPISLVWLGRYRHRLKSEFSLPGGKGILVGLFIAAVFVVFLELYNLIY
jgi:tyrosine-specific transport protein